MADLFLEAVSLKRSRVPAFDEYPFAIPAIRELDEIRLRSPVTFFIGENGTGKSTLLEALAVAMGFNAEGGPSPCSRSCEVRASGFEMLDTTHTMAFDAQMG